MADALTTLVNVKTMLGILSSDTSQNAILGLLMDQVSALITESCNRQHWLVANGPETRFLSGQGDEWLVYPVWPLRQVLVTGNTVQGGLTVSALAFTVPYTVANLFAGQSIQGLGVPDGTSIASVGTTTLTLSQAATLTGTSVPLLCGLAVYEDDTTGAAWGQSSGAFGPGTLLSPGLNYAVRWDRPDGLQPAPCQQSKSGMLLRINDVWRQQYGRIPYGLALYGATGFGNVRVQANVGYSTIPPDLESAALRVIARMRSSRKFGQLVTSGGYEGANVSFGPQIAEALGVLGGDVAAVLARYRIVGPLGSG